MGATSNQFIGSSAELAKLKEFARKIQLLSLLLEGVGALDKVSSSKNLLRTLFFILLPV